MPTPTDELTRAMTIGQQVLARRTKMGLTQQQVADEAGISLSFVSLIENDQRDPSLSTLKQITSALGGRVKILWEKK